MSRHHSYLTSGPVLDAAGQPRPVTHLSYVEKSLRATLAFLGSAPSSNIYGQPKKIKKRRKIKKVL